MAKYVLENKLLKYRVEGSFDELKSNLSEMTEKDTEVTNIEWEKVQLLEPEHLPFEVGLFLLYEQNSCFIEPVDQKHDDKVMVSIMAFEAKERLQKIEDKENRNDELMKNIIDDHIPTPYKKPPLGIMPKRFHDEERFKNLIAAIERYIEAKLQVPLEWIVEYNQLVKEVK